MSRIKICATSDTHGSHRQLKIPKCDVFIHAGDFSKKGIAEADAVEFLQWMDDQPARRKILVPGNHDGFFQQSHWKSVVPDTVDVLIHDWIELFDCKLKIFGSAWTPTFGHWYLTKSRSELLADWRRDAASIVELYGHPDLLVCHGPPNGLLDEVVDGSKIINVGCEGLAEAVSVLKPRLALFGHIHEALGQQVMFGKTLCSNVSYMDEYYRPVGRIFTIEI